MSLAELVLALVWAAPFLAFIRLARRSPSLESIAPVVHGPRLSVIVPARNEAGTIETVVRTVLASEYRDLELIVTQTRQALRSKKTLEEAVDGVGLEEQEHWVNFESYHRRNVTSAYTELEWED